MPRLTNVVIVDADEKGREILGYGFAGDGVEVSKAHDPAGLDALTTTPDTVIVACRNPEAQVMLNHLAKAERWRGVPVLTLVAEADDAIAPSGLPNVIALPAFVRDIITAAKLLSAGAIQVTDPDTVKEVSGSLSDFGLVFIVRTMVGLGWSGIVTVERGDRRGEIRIDQGDVVSATVSSLQGQAALHQLLLWEEAALSLKLRKVAQLGHGFPKGKDLLEENERFLRDFSHATKNLGHTHSLFVQDLEKTAELGGNIPAEIVPVLKLFDGHRTLGDALEDSPFRVFDTLRTMTRLLELGALRRKAIERPTGGLKGQMRRPQLEEWINRRGDVPTVNPRATSASATATAPLAAVDQRSNPQNRRRRRRRTGEMPLSEGSPRRDGGGPARRKSGNHNVVRPQPAESEPSAGSPVAVPAAVTPATERSGALYAQGELQVRAEEAAPAANMPESPSVVVALELGTSGESAPEANDASARPSNGYLAERSNGLSHPEPESPVAPEPATGVEAGQDVSEAEAVPVATGHAGARSAEIVVAEGEGPAVGQLAAPGAGPSILLDPRLVEEMDAFEMANSPPTPAPQVEATPNSVPPPSSPSPQAAAAPSTGDPAPAQAAQGAPSPVEPKPATVVSFVRNEGSGAHANNPALNNAPTVPLSAVQAHRPAEKGPAAPPRSPTPVRLGPEAAGPKGFDELESDFFAREADLYETETADNFEDLDGGGRRRR